VTRRTVVKAGKRDTVASIAARYKLSAGPGGRMERRGNVGVLPCRPAVVLHLPVRTVARAPVRVTSKNVKQVSTNSTAKPAEEGARPGQEALSQMRGA
jgi:membrane-bound lytic murein transglycosylase D